MVIECLIDLFNVSKKAKDFYWRKDQLHLDELELKKKFLILEQDINYLLMTFRANNHIKIRMVNANAVRQLVWIFYPSSVSSNEFMVITPIAEQSEDRKQLISNTIRYQQSNDIFESALKQKELIRISLNLQSKALSYLAKLSDYQYQHRFLNL